MMREESSEVGRELVVSVAVRYCRHGHLMAGANLYLRKGRNEPECRACRTAAGKRWKQKHPEKFKDYKRRYQEAVKRKGWVIVKNRRPLDEDERRALIDALRGGMTLSAVTDTRKGTRIGSTVPMMSLSRITFTRTMDPSFSGLIHSLVRNNRGSASGVVRIPKHRPAFTSTTIIRTNSWLDEIALPLVNKAVSAHVPFFMRDDIRQELLTMLWAGEIAENQITPTAKRLLTQQYSGYDLSSKFGHRSLDMPTSYDDGRPLIENVSRGLWSQ